MMRPEQKPSFTERHPVLGHFKRDVLNFTLGRVVYSILTSLAPLVFGYFFGLVSSLGNALLTFLCAIVAVFLLSVIYFALRAPYRFMAEQKGQLAIARRDLALQEMKPQSRDPELTVNIGEVHIVPFGDGCDCFVRTEIRSDSETPVRIMSYRSTLTVGEERYVGRRADATGYFLLDRSGGSPDKDGDPLWTIISETRLVNLADNRLVTRPDPVTGWLRFHFNGVPAWEMFGEPVGYARAIDEQTGGEDQVMAYDSFFVKTTATSITVSLTDSDGREWESDYDRISCEQSRTVKKFKPRN
jgi:hypothetical protein